MGNDCRMGSVVGLDEQPSRVAPNLYFWRAGSPMVSAGKRSAEGVFPISSISLGIRQVYGYDTSSPEIQEMCVPEYIRSNALTSLVQSWIRPERCLTCWFLRSHQISSTSCKDSYA